VNDNLEEAVAHAESLVRNFIQPEAETV